jgi:hypothetical protein
MSETKIMERNVERISQWIGRRDFGIAFLCLTGTLLLCSVALGQPADESGLAKGVESAARTQPPATQTPATQTTAATQTATGTLADAIDSITEVELKRHIDFLASDTLQGREAGTQGNYAASAYIVDQLRKPKLATISADGDYYQYFYPNFRNIFAVIPGSDEQLKTEYILVGGHYDHVGFGNRSNSRGPFGVVHNGADDNASGTAGVLEIAHALASLSPKPKRSILIAFWDGEEKGLLGSKHFADYPSIPLSKIRFHLNADMIGRLRPEGLEISGWRTAAGSRQFLAQQNLGGLKFRFMYSYKPESDHWPLFQHRVPSLMVHTGKHADYHRPSDDTHLLNMEGIRKVSQFMLRCAVAAANAETPPAFQDWSQEKSAAFTQIFDSPARNEPSRLGVTYNGKLAEDGIIQLTSVVSESPAKIAGLQVGDNVLALNGHSVKEASDFRTLVMTAPGDTVFSIRRQEAELEVPVALRGDPMLFGFRWTMDDLEPGSVIVTQVAAGSPADAARLKPHHRIRAVGGKKITTRDEFRKLLTETQNPVGLEVEFDGSFESLSIDRPILLTGEAIRANAAARAARAETERAGKK